MGCAASLNGIELLIPISGLEIYQCQQDSFIAAMHRTAACPVSSLSPEVPTGALVEPRWGPHQSASSPSIPYSCRVK